jgi:putative SOS response-associated peptidase YedK
MTRLYRLDAPAADIAARFGAEAGKDPWTGDYVAPGRPAPIVIRDEKWRVRRVRPMFWGVPPPPRGTDSITSVRNLESPFWIGTLRHTEFRCLIPATSFALWSGPAGARRQHWFAAADQPIFAMAGIVRFADEIPTFAMLTTDPNRLVAHHHPGAMPLILPAEAHERWLTADWKDAQGLVTPFPGQAMTVSDAPPVG